MCDEESGTIKNLALRARISRTSANSSYVSEGFFFKEDIRRAAASAHGARAVPVLLFESCCRLSVVV